MVLVDDQVIDSLIQVGIEQDIEPFAIARVKTDHEQSSQKFCPDLCVTPEKRI